jgi:ribonuclease BN (tRNA processing enzyme)
MICKKGVEKEMDMKIKVLGCSGAKFPGHNIPGFLLDDEILFDAGTLTGVLDEKAQLKIKNIFITHAHLDHVRSIPFLADNIILRNINHRVNIISISPVIKTIKKHLFNSSMWPDFTIIPNLNDAILNLVELKAGESLQVNNHTVTPYKVNHTVPAVGYLVEDKKKRRFFYTGDTGPTSETWEKIGDKKMHCLIIDVSFSNSMEDMAIRTGHLTPKLLKEELLKIKYMPELIYVTHLKPQYLKVITTELKELKMKNLKVLRDGDTIRI